MQKYIYAYGNPTVYTDPTGNLNVVGIDELSRLYQAGEAGTSYEIGSADFENMVKQSGLGSDIETVWKNDSLNLNGTGTRKRVLSEFGVHYMMLLISKIANDGILPSNIVSVEEGESTEHARSEAKALVGEAHIWDYAMSGLSHLTEGSNKIVNGTAIYSAKEHTLARAQRNIVHQYGEYLKYIPSMNDPLKNFVIDAADDVVTATNIVTDTGTPRGSRRDAQWTLLTTAASIELPFLRYGRFGKVLNKNDSIASEVNIYAKFSENAASRKHLDLNLSINERGLMAQERALAEASGWVKADGSTWWPPYDGAIPGTQRFVTLEPGSNGTINLVDRFGSTGGSYVSPEGLSLESRALRSIPDSPPSIYSVDGSIQSVEKAFIAPWFGQKGLGVQYKHPDSVQYYLDNLKLGAQ